LYDNLSSSCKKYLQWNIDERFGYFIPKQDTISIDRSPNPHSKNLYDDLEASSLNSLETMVAHLLDNHEKLIWWYIAAALQRRNQRWFDGPGRNLEAVSIFMRCIAPRNSS